MLFAIVLARFLNELAKNDKRINFGSLRILAAMMAEDKLSTPQLRRRFPEYTQSGIFRYLDELTRKGLSGKPGLGLLRRLAVERRGVAPEIVFGLTSKGAKWRERMTTGVDGAALSPIQLVLFFETLAKHSKRLNYGALRILVAIMIEETLSTPQLQRRFPEYEESNIRLYIDELSITGRSGKPGLDLIRLIAVEKRGKRAPEHVFGLTPKGKELSRRIERVKARRVR